MNLLEGQVSILPDVDIRFWDGALGRIPSTGTGVFITIGLKTAEGEAEIGKVYRLSLPSDPDTPIKLFGNGEYANKLLDAASCGANVVFAAAANSDSTDDILSAVEEAVEQSLVNGDAIFEGIIVMVPVDKSTAAAIGSYLTSLVSRHIYVWALLEARPKTEDEKMDDYVTNLISEWEGFIHPRVAASAFCATVTNLKGNTGFRNAIGSLTGLLARAKVSQDIGEVGAFPIPNIVSLPEDLKYSHIYALDQARFITGRTYDGYAGYYVTNPNMMMPETSDYAFIYARRVADKAAKITRKTILPRLKGEVLPPANDNPESPTKPTKSPTIQELKGLIEHALHYGMYKEGELYGYRVIIPEDQDLWATRKLKIKTKLAPTPHMDWITVDQSFENPFLTIGG
jgi:hypothetical protein